MGPLGGVTVIELAGLGALPFATLKLADMGADVIRVNRPSEVPDPPAPNHHREFDRGRRSIAVDLKQPDGVELILRLVERLPTCWSSHSVPESWSASGSAPRRRWPATRVWCTDG